ncbi:metallophosphoesterase [Thermodesulfobacteriota bacterium]
MKYAIIHLADIHYRKEESEGSLDIFNHLLDDLKLQKEPLSDYQFYIAITGDIVFSGEDSYSYSRFINDFDNKLNELGLTKDFRIIVPGNHDIDRSIFLSGFDYYHDTMQKNMETETTFNNYIKDLSYQDNKFENYQIFASEFAKYGIDYSTPGKGWILDENLGIFCLNTSLCSFGGFNKMKDKYNLSVFTRGIMDWCNDTDTSMNILLMHHPIAHFTAWCKKSIKQIIEDNFKLCLCGHDHEQDLYYNKISHNSLTCSAPQVYTSKDDLLGYSIILIDNYSVNKIIYREFINGNFLDGQRFSGSNDGIVSIQDNYHKSIELLEHNLNNSLSFFKGQRVFFTKPKISKVREFNDDPNLLDDIIKEPKSFIVTSHPQFGLTCLSHFMRMEAFKQNNFWVYIDSKHTKARNIKSEIDYQLMNFNMKSEDIKCIIIDSWDSSIIDHCNILKCIDDDFKDIPIIVMSNYTDYFYSSNFNFDDLDRNFELLHLQAMNRNKVRNFVSQYIQENNVEKEDVIVTKVIKDLEVLNVHRTPLNCLTLLKVFERDFHENLINRTKMIKAVLFILFTDADSFTYSSTKPNVDDCEYVLGRFCKGLIEKKVRSFRKNIFMNELKDYCSEKLITIDLETLLDILESNNIILQYNDSLEFKHRYWIYYFASTYMLQDESFRDYILNGKNYVNFPEIIEFYTGIDGRRALAIQILLDDLNELNDTVNNSIGIREDFNPFETLIWKPSASTIETIRNSISEKVEKSNLPRVIKDQHADLSYDSEAPYDQSIGQFLNEYSVISLIQNIRASSRALRNSNYISPKLKKDMIQAILNGWEQMSKVIFWLSPTLAKKGNATYDGLYVYLEDKFFDESEKSLLKNLETIIKHNPFNVVKHFKDDLSSMKMGPLIFDRLKGDLSVLHKHFISLFLVFERPIGWYKCLFEFMNLLHRNSFILGDLYNTIRIELKKGFVSSSDKQDLKMLLSIVAAKHDYAPRIKLSEIPIDMAINEKNLLEIDKIIATSKKKN